ncbi:MAG: hypothetical protein WDZ68_00995 [Candidatus Paceibacterota bacterium]
MLYVFYGNDTVAVRSKAHAFVDEQAKDEMTLNTIEADNYYLDMIRNAVRSISLFSGNYVYLIDTPKQSAELQSELMEMLGEMSTSPHTFIVVEETLLAPERKKYEKYANQIEERKREQKEVFNMFSLADALSRKDKKLLWLVLNDAVRAGLSSEEIISMLWWQLKTLRIASVTASAKEAGMKDFPYNKAKRALGKFKTGEIEALSQSLLTYYHDARRGQVDLDLALEQWVLSL